MNRVVFLLEEYSMKALLDGLLPRLFPDLLFQCVPHDGNLTRQRNRSPSFQAMMDGVERLGSRPAATHHH